MAWVVASPFQPEGEHDEDGNPVWACEIQTVGGYAVQAIVYASTEAQAADYAALVCAALAKSEAR